MPKSKNTRVIDFPLNLDTALENHSLINKKNCTLLNTCSNNYPIVMVHGHMGWGSNELFGLNYWGGFFSLKDYLNRNGFTVFTPTIGPVSSNWDRACELFAYLKGGIVDYGEAHSKKYGHARYGRTYPGVYPELGSKSEDGTIKKIHLIGHSMGGQTIRVLTQLLEKGNTDELEVTPESNISELFKGRNSWVSSITALATPHDGTPLARETSKFIPFIQQFLASLGAITGVTDLIYNPYFDYSLDQWGLHKEHTESLKDYIDKVISSNLWNETKDFSLWELTPEGAKELNSWISLQDNVYYFSLACLNTHKDLLTKHQIHNITMLPQLIPTSEFIGSFTSNNPNEVTITNDWWPNDGLVSVISAQGPHEGSRDRIINFNKIPQKGVWNYLGTKQHTDHSDIVSLYKFHPELKHEYLKLAELLASLTN